MYYYNVTVRQTEDHNKDFIYFIDGVYYQQKGFKTEQEAQRAGEMKVKELKKYNKKP